MCLPGLGVESHVTPPSCLISITPPASAASSCTLQVAGVAGSSATYATLCDVFAKQGKWDKLRTAVQVKGG